MRNLLEVEEFKKLRCTDAEGAKQLRTDEVSIPEVL